jgi:phage-related minor tail protein
LGYLGSNALELQNVRDSVSESSGRELHTSTQLRTIGSAISGVGEAIDNIVGIYDTWKPLVDKIEVVVNIASTIAEVTPLFV